MRVPFAAGVPETGSARAAFSDGALRPSASVPAARVPLPSVPAVVVGYPPSVLARRLRHRPSSGCTRFVLGPRSEARLPGQRESRVPFSFLGPLAYSSRSFVIRSCPTCFVAAPFGCRSIYFFYEMVALVLYIYFPIPFPFLG